MDEWRGGSKAAEQGWADAGVRSRQEKKSPQAQEKGTIASAQGFVEGMVVRHDQYGTGRVTLVSGSGMQCKIKVQFRSAGERTFLADKAKLAIIR